MKSSILALAFAAVILGTALVAQAGQPADNTYGPNHWSFDRTRHEYIPHGSGVVELRAQVGGGGSHSMTTSVPTGNCYIGTCSKKTGSANPVAGPDPTPPL